MDEGRFALLRQVRREPGGRLLDLGHGAGLAEVPEPAEPPQLAFQVAVVALAEPLQAGAAPVDRVQLDESVDQLVDQGRAGLRGVEAGGQAGPDDVALDLLHHVERHSERGLVLVDQEHAGDPDAAALERPQQPGLADDVVGARRQRRTRRPAQHDLGALAADEVRDVAVAVADRVGGQRPAADPGRVEHRLQRAAHQQRRPLLGGGLFWRVDDAPVSHDEMVLVGTAAVRSVFGETSNGAPGRLAEPAADLVAADSPRGHGPAGSAPRLGA